MNVKELIETLQTFPQDLRIVITGWEGGVADLSGVEKILIELNVRNSWYLGSHEIVDAIPPKKEKSNFCEAIIIR